MSSRAAYLEMAARGVDIETGRVDGLDPRSTSAEDIARLRMLLDRHRFGIRDILCSTDLDVRAVRAEATAGQPLEKGMR